MKLQYIISNVKDPYFNVALEKYLLDTVTEDSLILYLWQNTPAVFAGPGREAFEGYSISGLMEDEIMPVRRLSGGKAEMINEEALHYTFLSCNGNYDLNMQLAVIREACQVLGLQVEITPENHLYAGTKVLCIPDYYQTASKIMHHSYLPLKKDPRIAALKNNCPELTEEKLLNTLLDAYEQVYGAKAESYPIESIDFSVLRSYEKIFGNEDWIYNG